MACKGHLISKCPFGVFKSPKKQHFELNWTLIVDQNHSAHTPLTDYEKIPFVMKLTNFKYL